MKIPLRGLVRLSQCNLMAERLQPLDQVRGQPSQIRATIIETAKSHDVQGVVRANVESGSIVMTDTLKSYVDLRDQFIHMAINHAVKYAEGRIHTNGLENFWSLFKRCVKGTHVSIDPAHLYRYVDSQAFRFNNRDGDDRSRFLGVANSITGKRLTYKALIQTPLEACTESANFT